MHSMYARALVFQLHTVRTLTVTIQFERSGVDRCEEWLHSRGETPYDHI